MIRRKIMWVLAYAIYIVAVSVVLAVLMYAVAVKAITP